MTIRNEDGPVQTVSEEILRRIVGESLVGVLAGYNLSGIQETVRQHDKLLRGNGRPGIMEEISMLKPVVAKLDDHLAAYKKFELAAATERQAVRDDIKALTVSIDSLQSTVETEMAAFKERIKPFETLMANFTRFYTAVGVIGFIGGLVLAGLAWVATNWEVIKGWLHHGN